MILVLAGTTEGREIAVALEKAGEQVIATTATAYGGELLRNTFKGEIISRPLESSELEKLIMERVITKVVDATHPYAEQISAIAQQACLRTEVPYERIERNFLKYSGEVAVIEAEDAAEAASIAAAYRGNIFLAIGSRKLQFFSSVIEPERLVVRILPLDNSLEKCLELGIPPKNIIAMQGPFDEELNRLLLRRYDAAVLVTKESGSAGGTAEKIRASCSLGLPVILITRPKP